MYTYKCKIVNVVDGDTLDIIVDLGFEVSLKERVRLIGVDTPEVFGAKAVTEGKTASEFTKQWVAHRESRGHFKYVSRKYNARDKYGRSLGTLIWVNPGGFEESINEALIAEGWADT